MHSGTLDFYSTSRLTTECGPYPALQRPSLDPMPGLDVCCHGCFLHQGGSCCKREAALAALATRRTSQTRVTLYVTYIYIYTHTVYVFLCI